MRVLIASSRHPWPPYSGDRLRTTMWLDALAGVADVTLLIPEGSVLNRRVTIVHPKQSVWRYPPAGWAALRRGLPLHTVMAAGFDWRGALRDVARSGSFDAAVVVLSRLDPWVGELPAAWTVLDAIDSLAHSMQERARESSSFVVRSFWRSEAKRMAKLESDAATRYDRVLVVNSDERQWFGERAIAVPIGVEVRPADLGRARRYDFGFWGRLAYFANREAAMHLANDIWPRIRSALPSASLVIAGADAPQEVRRLNGRNGITVESPATDIAQLARDIRVGIFPIRFGTGQLTKILEAAEAGCAIVASPRAMRGLDPLREHVVVAEEAEEIASVAVSGSRDSERARKLGAGARAAVEQNFSRAEMKKRLAATVMERR
ncbi:MAG: glycosyltransferase [Thermoanaerobaculia bacterium]